MCNTLGCVCSLTRALRWSTSAALNPHASHWGPWLSALERWRRRKCAVSILPVGSIGASVDSCFCTMTLNKSLGLIFPRWSKQDLNVVSCTWYCSKSWSSMSWLCSSNEICLPVRAAHGTAHSFVLAALSCQFCWLHCPAFHRAPSSLE